MPFFSPSLSDLKYESKTHSIHLALSYLHILLLYLTYKLVFRDSGYKYETSVVKDLKWDFYYENLYPSEIEMYLIYSEKIILQLMAEGDNIFKPREVEHYVSFDTKSQMDRFVKNVRNIGFEFKDEIDNKELLHAVAIIKEHSLDQDTLKSVISELLEYIKKDHGRYELWSSVIAK